LLNVFSPAHIAEMLVDVAPIMLVCEYPLPLSADTLLLPLNGLCEGEVFVAKVENVVVVRKGAVDWIAQQHDELDARQHFRYSPGYKRVEQIVRCGFSSQKGPSLDALDEAFFEVSRKVGAVPG